MEINMNQHAEVVNVLRALKGLNGYATSRQIGAEYRRQHKYEINEERIEAALATATTQGWVTTPSSGYYKLTPDGKDICANEQAFPAVESKANAKETGRPYGSKEKTTPDDVFCPFCKVYYPFRTVECPVCKATIGSRDQARGKSSGTTTVEHGNASVNQQTSPPTSGGSGNSVSIGGIILGIISGLSAVGASSWVYGTGAMVSESSDTGMGDVVNGSTSTTAPTTETSTGVVEDAGTVGTTMLLGLPGITSATGVTSGTIDDSTGPVFFQDSFGNWHFGDSVPYSIVEKRAERIYDVLHKESADKRKNLLVVAQNPEYGDLIKQLFASQRTDVVEDKLDVWLSLLE